MNFYEKIKNKSIEEMTELLVAFYIVGTCSLFSFTPDESFIKSLPNYDELYNVVKTKLMEEDYDTV